VALEHKNESYLVQYTFTPDHLRACPAWGEGRCAADAVFVCASRRPKHAGDFYCRLFQCPQRAQFIPEQSETYIPEQSEAYICHDLPRIKTFCSNN